MNKLDYRTLHEALRTQGRYETPAENRPSHPVKTSFFHTLEGARVVALDVIGMCAWLTLRKRFDYLDWARLCTRSINFAERLGATVTLENFLPRAQHAGPVVYVSNHMSIAPLDGMLAL
jgi:sugar phosphate isomerase/epimerase